MPQSKIIQAQQLVVHAAHAGSLTRGEYRSLLGSPRHVAMCVRPARVSLQRLHEGEWRVHRVNRISVYSAMRNDLRWWRHILASPLLNGVPLAFFGADPPRHISVIPTKGGLRNHPIPPDLLHVSIPSRRTEPHRRAPPRSSERVRHQLQGSARMRVRGHDMLHLSGNYSTPRQVPSTFISALITPRQ
jgi:hypothetical protein